jgi:hypothetical protein
MQNSETDILKLDHDRALLACCNDVSIQNNVDAGPSARLDLLSGA